MDRPLAGTAIEGAPQRFAVDRHDLADIFLQRRGPSDEGRFETRRIERVEHIREGVMARNAVFERQKAPQEGELGFAILFDLDPTLGAAQHPHQSAQQQLGQRVEHFRLLPRLRHLVEKFQPAQPVTHRPSHR